MPKLRYGSQDQVTFRDLNEFYFALGFLANPKNAEIRWENNEEQGAWGSEGRIHCLVPESTFPQFFRFTAGRGSVYARINCNEYVGCLVQEHNFNYNGRGQNVSRILATVPDQYRAIFMAGYGGNLDVNPEYRQVRKKARVNSTGVRSSANMSPASVKIEKPETPPIPVEVGETLIHLSFGTGTIYEVAGNYIRIRFDSVGEKTFRNPDAFEKGFIKRE